MIIDAFYGKISSFFRKQRMQRFIEYFNITSDTRMLDVGGTIFNWTLTDVQPQLFMVNIRPARKGNVHRIVADGCALPFCDNTFDVVFSNSVIEHLSTAENQNLFAQECRRVGKNYYVQTPNKWFFIEPHYIAPLVHFLPRRVQVRLIRRFTVRGWLTKPTQVQCDALVNELRLIDARELQMLFPDATIHREKFLGMTKSLIAMRKSYQDNHPSLRKQME